MDVYVHHRHIHFGEGQVIKCFKSLEKVTMLHKQYVEIWCLLDSSHERNCLIDGLE